MNRIFKHRVTAVFMLLIFGISLVGNLFSGINTHADTTDDDWKTPKITLTAGNGDQDITNIEDLSNYTSLVIQLHWEIPDTATITDGETLTFTVPDKVNINFDGVGIPKTATVFLSNGVAIGKMSIPYGSRTGTIELNDYFASPEHNTGRNFDISFLGSGVNNSGENPGTDTGDKDFIGQTGWIADGDHDEYSRPTNLTWQVVLNQNAKTVSGLVLTDKIGPGQEFDPSSLSIQDSNHNDIQGVKIDYNKDSNILVLNFSKPITDKIDVIFKTDITTVINKPSDSSPSDIYNWKNDAESSYTGISEETGGEAVTVPDGPVINDTPTTYKGWGISSGGSGYNGSVVLTKTDVTTKKALPGATFSLFKSDDSVLKDSDGNAMYQNIETDNDGQIDISNLPIGDYYFVEDKAPENYLLNKDKKYQFSITAKQELPQTVDVTNQKDPSKINGSVTLTKTASDTGKPLAGATFDLQRSDGTPVATDLTTNDDGQITYDNLTGGDYQFVETKAPAGYELNNSKFTIAEDNNVEVPIIDTKKTDTNTNVPDTDTSTGKVVLTKFDAKTQDKLQGAKFELDNSVGDVLKDNLTTDANGQITVDNLKTGKYQFVETQAPNGYVLNSDAISFEVKDGTVNVSAYNNQKDDTTVPVDPSDPENPTPVDPTNPIDPSNDPDSTDRDSTHPIKPNDPQLPTNSDPSINQTEVGNSVFSQIPGISSNDDDSDKAVLPQTGSISSIFATVFGGMLLLFVALELFTKYREI